MRNSCALQFGQDGCSLPITDFDEALTFLDGISAGIAHRPHRWTLVKTTGVLRTSSVQRAFRAETWTRTRRTGPVAVQARMGLIIFRFTLIYTRLK